MRFKSLVCLISVNALALLSAVPASASDSAPFDFQYDGGSVFSFEAYTQGLKAARSGSAHREGGALSLTGPVKGAASFSFTCPVEKNAEYLFRARVKSNDQLVARIGSLSMSYNDLGNWQTVTGLYRVNNATSVEIKLDLKSLSEGKGSAAEVKEVSFVRVERPKATARRAFSGKTDLVKNGKAVAAIVIPAGAGDYRKLAGEIVAAVKEKTGVELPVVSDAEGTEKDYPVLLPPYRSENLILLGRLGNNRAFWAAYNHFLTAVDGFYPGGNGYAVHTAANVFHTGFNHLIIGGTTDEGVKRGAQKFLEKIAAASADGKNLQLPWLLEVDLQGACLDLFKKENAKWEETPENGLLPKPEPGYGNISRWYVNAMGYYWTGWDSYKKRASHYLEQILAEKAPTHHYLVEFFVRTVEMFDESGVISPAQVAQLDALVTQNFLDCMTGPDLNWMTTFAPPYGQIGLVNRHQIAPWLGDYKMAEFVTDRLTPQGGMKDLADFRRQEKERMFVDFAKHRSNPSLPGGISDECYEEINAVFFRFSLEKELYKDFFASGNAHKALALERINPRTGQLAFPSGNRDSKLVLGIMACLTGNPEYKWLWAHLPEVVHIRGYFQNRYTGDVRRYNPDASAPEAVPTSWTGLRFTPNPVDNDARHADHENYYFVSYGSGFQPDDDYIGFNGVSGYTMPSGLVTNLISNGVVWMGGLGEGGRFNSNSASAIRTDSLPAKAKFDDQSRCLWSAELATGSAMRFRQLLTKEIEWTRDFLVLGRGAFAFRDQFTAREDGDYSLSVSWHPAGNFTRKGNTGSFVTRDGKLQLALLGNGFTMETAQSDTGETSLRNQTLQKLAKGQSIVSYTVIQTSKAHATKLQDVRLLEGDQLAIGSPGKETRVAWKPAPSPAFGSDADLVVQTESQTGFYNARRLTLNQRPVADLKQPASFTVSTAGKWNHLPEGTSLTAEEGRAISSALRALPEAPDSRPVAASQTAGNELGIGIKDAQKAWEKGWHYDGFLRPAKVSSYSNAADGVIDFGKALNLSEIRANPLVAGPWQAAKLPETILVATENPQTESSWKAADGKRAWRPGLRTGNYGEAHPEAKDVETLFLPSVPARYVKTVPPARLNFFTDSHKEGRHPLRVETGDFLKNGKIQTFVVSDVFPQFPRLIRNDDLSVALLDETGAALFEKDLAGPVQAVRLLDRDGDGRKELFVLHGSGVLEIYNLDGKLQASADLYKLHQDFHKTYGRNNTRHPAGGYILPFAVGLWRPDAAGHRKIVVSRYGAFTFLNPDLSLEGVLSVSGYGTPGLLPEPVDFGSGLEQVCAERMRIWQIGGSGEPTVRDPGGAQFWPQVYNLLKVTPEDETSKAPLGGMPIVRFELLPGVTAKPRYLLIARGTSLCIYDGREKKMQYSWNGQAPISGVGILAQSEGKLDLLVSTGDSLLWRFAWDNGVEQAPTLSARAFPDTVSSMQETGGEQKSIVIAGEKGLYVLPPGGEFQRIAEGAFQAAAPVSVRGNRVESVAATTRGGEVIEFRAAKAR